MTAGPSPDQPGGPDADATAARAPDLLSFVTHEIGNHLTVVAGFAELLADGIGDLPLDLAQEFSRAIVRGSDQMRALLQSISDLRRLDGGPLEVHQQVVDLVPVVGKVVDQWRPQLGSRQVTVVIPDELVTSADPARVGQILATLLANVATFTPSTSAAVVELAVAGDQVELSVSDDGPGIPPGRTGELFQRFSRLDATVKGAGIGLYVSRHLARAHGGDLVLVEGASGARFLLTLPHRPAG